MSSVAGRCDRRLTAFLSVALMILIGSFAQPVLEASAKKKPKSAPITVFPLPKTPVAGERTTFSFRGIEPGAMGPIKVFGSESKRMGGTRLEHSDGEGVSWVPNKNFQPGEKVTVYTKRNIRRANNGKFWVRIGEFYGKDDPGAPAPGFNSPSPALKSRPDLRPPLFNNDPNSLVTAADQVDPGRIFLALKKQGVSILDNQARTVWFRPVAYGETGEQIYNFQTQDYRGKPVLTYWRGAQGIPGYAQTGYFEILNQKYNRIASFKTGNGYEPDTHEFDITPRNTALVLAYQGVYWDATQWGGPAQAKVIDNVIQEIDIKTGAVLFEWHSLGNVGIGSSMADPNQVGWGALNDEGLPRSFDYFHVNSATDDGEAILISARRTSTIYRINRTTGRVEWRLRGDGAKPATNDFQMGDGTRFAYQHDVRRTESGDLILFDNAQGNGVPSIADQSSAVVLRLAGLKPGKKKRATLVTRYTHPKPGGVLSVSQANAREVSNGNVFVGWGQVARFSEFTPTGQLALDFTFNTMPTATGISGNISYRAFKDPWTGTPAGRPAINSETTGAGQGKVWASWNGATVTSWKVYSGASVTSLTEVASAPWNGLETEIPVPSGLGTYVQVAAFDEQGAEIGRSTATAVGVQSSGLG